ncbi:hypothetical protein BESB_084390 [Besnoitia besnoiti]|uniref:Ribosomal RNA-processing protein 7 C-terminal domain-containing protein n=1 Tax=Besnoitia besnoiti TaxID=94643 RepID=A0A2A9MCW8_BESBE|nr:hypothetical protein BESB_084390 [Besnoitia besnoiti]PFH33240.1 hypothetical protein BESB_084390 [Besnoitia besnoiti]
MKLESFRRLRIPAQKDSPFCWEVLVKQDGFFPTKSALDADAETAQLEGGVDREKSRRTLFVTSVPPLLSVAKLSRVFEEAFGEIEDVKEKVVVQRGAEERLRKRKASGYGVSSSTLQPSCSAIRLLHFVFRSALSVSSLLSSALPVGGGQPNGPQSKHTPDKAEDGRGPREALASDAKAVDGSLRLKTDGAAGWLQEAAAFARTPDELQREVDEFMENHDLKKEIERQRLKQQQVTDEDGFTLVVGSSATAADGTTFKAIRRSEAGGSPLGVAVAGSRGFAGRAGARRGAPDDGEEGAVNLFVQQNAAACGVSSLDEARGGTGGRRRKKKRKGGIEEDFYRFQRREKRRKEFLDVQRSLAADEKRVEAMEKANKFSL